MCLVDTLLHNYIPKFFKLLLLEILFHWRKWWISPISLGNWLIGRPRFLFYFSLVLEITWATYFYSFPKLMRLYLGHPLPKLLGEFQCIFVCFIVWQNATCFKHPKQSNCFELLCRFPIGFLSRNNWHSKKMQDAFSARGGNYFYSRFAIPTHLLTLLFPWQWFNAH